MPALPLLLLSTALAHRPGLSYAEIRPGALVLTLSRAELAAVAPMEDLDASRDLLQQRLIGRVTVVEGGAPCALGAPVLRPVSGGEVAPGATADERDGVQIEVPLDCPTPGAGTYTAGFLGDLSPGHRQLLEVGGAPAAVLDAGNPTATFEGQAHAGGVFGRFLALGVEHIWTGYDHLAFLAALLLAAPSLRAMLYIVTGFTLAHSITLTLAALGIVVLSPALVEPAIAVTVAFVGFENLARPPVRRRVALTFALGLIHGFGFAGLLQEIGLPQDALTLALVAFNAGVELGQAGIVLLLLPLLLRLRRFPWWEARVVPVLSVAIGLFGVGWLVQRVS